MAIDTISASIDRSMMSFAWEQWLAPWERALCPCGHLENTSLPIEPANKSRSEFTFPVGYHEFHKDQLFNFQLNRWYSLGYARLEDMKEAGPKIKTFEDWKNEMIELAGEAISDGRLMNAAFYYRAAEFYTLQDDPEKELLYDKFISLFYEVFQNDGIERFEVPYQDSFLPAMKIAPPNGNKMGTIVMHGGFDSLIEEFYSWMRYFSDHGYEVIAFEGLGQGAALRKYGLALDYEWEKPAKAILDYFGLDNVSWIGISMGGRFCFRADAFDPRIKRVIASSIAFDDMKGVNIVLRTTHTTLTSVGNMALVLDAAAKWIEEKS